MRVERVGHENGAAPLSRPAVAGQLPRGARSERGGTACVRAAQFASLALTLLCMALGHSRSLKSSLLKLPARR